MKEHEVLTNTDWVALFDFRATLRESIAKNESDKKTAIRIFKEAIKRHLKDISILM